MKKLCSTNISAFFNILQAMKEAYDAGGISVAKAYAQLDADIESYYETEMEHLYDAAEFVKEKVIYMRDENGNFDEDSEALYSEFFFSSTDMTEYYRRLYQLYKNRQISGKEYRMKRCEMADFVKRWLYNTDCYICGGMGCYMRTKINHKYASSIHIYLDYNMGCCNLTGVVIALITIFDAYTRKLRELKMQYADMPETLEAAL